MVKFICLPAICRDGRGQHLLTYSGNRGPKNTKGCISRKSLDESMLEDSLPHRTMNFQSFFVTTERSIFFVSRLKMSRKIMLRSCLMNRTEAVTG